MQQRATFFADAACARFHITSISLLPFLPPPLAQAERAKAAAQPYVEGAQEVASDTAAAAKGTGEVSRLVVMLCCSVVLRRRGRHSRHGEVSMALPLWPVTPSVVSRQALLCLLVVQQMHVIATVYSTPTSTMVPALPTFSSKQATAQLGRAPASGLSETAGISKLRCRGCMAGRPFRWWFVRIRFVPPGIHPSPVEPWQATNAGFAIRWPLTSHVPGHADLQWRRARVRRLPTL